jgi:hypothetical protein
MSDNDDKKKEKESEEEPIVLMLRELEKQIILRVQVYGRSHPECVAHARELVHFAVYYGLHLRRVALLHTGLALTERDWIAYDALYAPTTRLTLRAQVYSAYALLGRDIRHAQKAIDCESRAGVRSVLAILNLASLTLSSPSSPSSSHKVSSTPQKSPYDHPRPRHKKRNDLNAHQPHAQGISKTALSTALVLYHAALCLALRSMLGHHPTSTGTSSKDEEEDGGDNGDVLALSGRELVAEIGLLESQVQRPDPHPGVTPESVESAALCYVLLARVFYGHVRNRRLGKMSMDKAHWLCTTYGVRLPTLGCDDALRDLFFDDGVWEHLGLLLTCRPSSLSLMPDDVRHLTTSKQQRQQQQAKGKGKGKGRREDDDDVAFPSMVTLFGPVRGVVDAHLARFSQNVFACAVQWDELPCASWGVEYTPLAAPQSPSKPIKAVRKTRHASPSPVTAVHGPLSPPPGSLSYEPLVLKSLSSSTTTTDPLSTTTVPSSYSSTSSHSTVNSGVRKSDPMNSLAVMLAAYRTQPFSMLESRVLRPLFARCLTLISGAYLRHRVQMHLKRHQYAALRIQAFLRGSMARKSVHKQQRAAQRLSFWMARHARGVREILWGAAFVTIARVLCGYGVRRRMQKMRHQVIRIQSGVRGYLQRKKSTVQKRSGARIVSWIKTLYAKRHYDRWRAAAQVIQTALRGALQRHKYRRMKRAVHRIESFWGAVLVRRPFKCMRRAVVAFQAAVRGSVVRMLVKYHQRAAAALQRVARGWLARRRVARIRNAAQVIVRQLRKRSLVLHRQLMLEQELQHQELSLAIKSIHGVSSSSSSSMNRHPRVDARLKWQFMLHYRIRLRRAQAIARAWSDCLSIHTRQHAATSLQAWSRGIITRQWLRKQQAAAIRIQALARGVVTRRSAYHNTSMARIRQAALLLQSLWRGYGARCHLHRQRQAVLVMEAVYRRYVALRGVVRLQAVVRGAVSRQRIAVLHHSAAVLQRAYRTHVVRVHEATVLAAKRHAAAVRIQALVRGSVVRQSWKGARSSMLSAVTVVRRWLMRREVRQRVVPVQAIVRRWLVCRRCKTMRLAALTIQRLYRMHQVRAACAEAQRAAVVLQRVARKLRVVREERRQAAILAEQRAEEERAAADRAEVLALERDAAAAAVQRIVRGWLARQLVAELRGASPKDAPVDFADVVIRPDDDYSPPITAHQSQPFQQEAASPSSLFMASDAEQEEEEELLEKENSPRNEVGTGPAEGLMSLDDSIGGQHEDDRREEEEEEEEEEEMVDEEVDGSTSEAINSTESSSYTQTIYRPVSAATRRSARPFSAKAPARARPQSASASLFFTPSFVRSRTSSRSASPSPSQSINGSPSPTRSRPQSGMDEWTTVGESSRRVARYELHTAEHGLLRFLRPPGGSGDVFVSPHVYRYGVRPGASVEDDGDGVGDEIRDHVPLIRPSESPPKPRDGR